jgi:hypothetical protein
MLPNNVKNTLRGHQSGAASVSFLPWNVERNDEWRAAWYHENHPELIQQDELFLLEEVDYQH